MRLRTRWLCAPAAVLFASAAFGDVIVVPSVQDTTIYEDPAGGLSNGSGSAMFSGRNAAETNSIRRALLRFDVAAAVPAGATIDAVSLRLFNDASNAVDATIELHTLTAAWGEGASLAPGNQGGGGPAQPGDATWLHRSFNATLWAAAGGDFAPGASASAVVGGAGSYVWASTAAFVSDVQQFLDTPASNFGWLLLGDESAPSTGKRFATREATNTVNRPSLTITYTPIPEPAGLLLLGMALLARQRHPNPPRQCWAPSRA